MKNYIIILILIFFMNSCDKSKDIKRSINLNKVKIEDSSNSKNLNFLNIVEEFKYVKLETTNKNLIGEIHDVIITQEKIFVFDRETANSVYAFDKNGKFLKKIGDKGDGPGEYRHIQAITLNEADNHLVLYCSKSLKLIKFSLEGEFISEKRIGLMLRDLEYIGKDTLSVFTHGIYNDLPSYGELTSDFISINPNNLKIYKTQFENGTKIGVGSNVLTLNKYFSKYKEDIYLNWLFNDTIYKINKSRAKPFLLIDFGRKKVRKNQFSELTNNEIFNLIIEDENRAIIRPIHIADNKLLIEFSKGIDRKRPNQNYRILYDINNGKSIQFKNILHKEDCNWNFPIGTYNDNFISVLYPKSFKCIEDLNLTKDILSLKNVNYENPVLFIYKFKNLKDFNNEKN